MPLLFDEGLLYSLWESRAFSCVWAETWATNCLYSPSKTCCSTASIGRGTPQLPRSWRHKGNWFPRAILSWSCNCCRTGKRSEQEFRWCKSVQHVWTLMEWVDLYQSGIWPVTDREGNCSPVKFSGSCAPFSRVRQDEVLQLGRCISDFPTLVLLKL